MTHSRRRCRAPPHRGHCRLGVRACCVGDAALPFIFLSSLQRMSSTSEARRRAKIWPTLACSPRTAPDVVALRGGPQPGGVMHPPNPRRWIHGEVQATLQIYPWSNNTRTHGYLEWFGPPERNTLRPLRVVLLLDLWMNLSFLHQVSPPTFSFL